jgi:hypothetical protein
MFYAEAAAAETDDDRRHELIQQAMRAWHDARPQTLKGVPSWHTFTPPAPRLRGASPKSQSRLGGLVRRTQPGIFLVAHARRPGWKAVEQVRPASQ